MIDKTAIEKAKARIADMKLSMPEPPLDKAATAASEVLNQLVTLTPSKETQLYAEVDEILANLQSRGKQQTLDYVKLGSVLDELKRNHIPHGQYIPTITTRYKKSYRILKMAKWLFHRKEDVLAALEQNPDIDFGPRTMTDYLNKRGSWDESKGDLLSDITDMYSDETEIKDVVIVNDDVMKNDAAKPEPEKAEPEKPEPEKPEPEKPEPEKPVDREKELDSTILNLSKERTRIRTAKTRQANQKKKAEAARKEREALADNLVQFAVTMTVSFTVEVDGRKFNTQGLAEHIQKNGLPDYRDNEEISNVEVSFLNDEKVPQ